MCPTFRVGFASESQHPSEALVRLLCANCGRRHFFVAASGADDRVVGNLSILSFEADYG